MPAATDAPASAAVFHCLYFSPKYATVRSVRRISTRVRSVFTPGAVDLSGQVDRYGHHRYLLLMNEPVRVENRCASKGHPHANRNGFDPDELDFLHRRAFSTAKGAHFDARLADVRNLVFL